MVNYYFKYIEFLDTVFLALKKRLLCKSFHHISITDMAFTPVLLAFLHAWSAICLNLGVHVVMYYYYCATAGGAKPWWKKHLTTMQIIQFIIMSWVLDFGVYQHFAFAYWPHLPHISDCTSDEETAYVGGVLTIFLGLFVNFYVRTYRKVNKDGTQKEQRIQVTRNPEFGQKVRGCASP
ncbi:hypothetical protein OG21DRAFT_1413533 [Imleria badia]|nr:hypothetical protein OG21DRAFT_1413533 [Imleria badia]